jgi:hypothetical protein
MSFKHRRISVSGTMGKLLHFILIADLFWLNDQRKTEGVRSKITVKTKRNQKIRRNMNKGIGIALLAVGIALIIYGFNASASVSSDMSRAFTGAPTYKTLWFLLGGSATAIVGAVMAFRGSKA